MSTDSKDVRVRFAPSPTGHFHLGGARTTLFNWLFARKHGGKIILRIEDTDTARSREEYEIELVEVLRWLGIDWDEGPIWTKEKETWSKGSKGEYGPYHQSERTALYKKYLEQLIQEKKAYHCYCTKEELEAERESLAAQSLPPKYGGHCRNLKEVPKEKLPQAIRFVMPEIKVEIKDIIRGTVSFDAGLFGDVIIAKNLEMPLYNFAVVIDDELMRITHVIRGEEHLGNTPKQILIQRALGFREPLYAHLPLILNPDRSKMSKRYTETSALSYREAGYLPETLANFLPLLGWHPKDDREVLRPDELVKEFELERVQKAGAVFNEEKLNWLNREYMKKLTDEELGDRILALDPPITHRINDREFFTRAVHAIRERMNTLREFDDLAAFFFTLPDYDAKILVWKNDPLLQTKKVLEELLNVFGTTPQEFDTNEKIHEMLSPLANQYGRGSVFWPLRVALSGREASPDPVEIARVLGPHEVKQRLEIAIKKLGS